MKNNKEKRIICEETLCYFLENEVFSTVEEFLCLTSYYYFNDMSWKHVMRNTCIIMIDVT